MIRLRNSTTYILSILAGICIGLGGTVYIACDNKYIGAILFSIGLITICKFGLYLFTGKIGYVNDKKTVLDIIRILFGNFVGTACIGTLLCMTNKYDAVLSVCENKLAMPLQNAFILAIFCGVIMFIAVNMFKEDNSFLGILIGIPTFILAGFEHSIADMFYFCLGGMITGEVLIFLGVVILGNAVGAIVFKRIWDSVRSIKCI